jgi:hypothetical protein
MGITLMLIFAAVAPNAIRAFEALGNGRVMPGFPLYRLTNISVL